MDEDEESGSGLSREQMRETLENIYHKSLRTFKEDSWGQIVEAAEDYARISDQICGILRSESSRFIFSSHHRRILHQCALCFFNRSKCMNSIELVETPSLKEIRLVIEYWSETFTPSPWRCDIPFPIDTTQLEHQKIEVFQKEVINKAKHTTGSTSSTKGDTDKDDADDDKYVPVDFAEVQSSKTGTLLKMPPTFKSKNQGDTLIALRFEKIGMKDALKFIDPVIRLNVYCSGVTVCPPQTTGVAKLVKDSHLFYGSWTFLSISHEQLLAMNALLVFEFIHFKPKKKKHSVKCYAIMEMDELVNGSVVLELYRKPTKPKRDPKVHKLHTTKDLFLHLKIKILQVDGEGEGAQS
eukprot:g1060.t1